MVCNGDVLTDLDLGALIAAHRDHGARATIALHRVEDPSAYGLVRTGEDGVVTAFVEKPPPGVADVDTINAGTYVFEPDVLELIPPGRAVSVEREVFPELVGAGLFALHRRGAVAGHRHAGQLPGGEHGVDAGGRAGRSDGD